MNLTTRVKNLLNVVAKPFNLRVETNTLPRREAARLERLRHSGYFDRQAFPTPPCLLNSDWQALIPVLAQYRAEIARLNTPGQNDVAYDADNGFYFPPDSDVLYAMTRHFKPSRIIEIGAGNSSRIIRQAILDGELDTTMIAIDPAPRADVVGYVDQVKRQAAEQLSPEWVSEQLRPGDFLFIDSSHTVSIGNDCVFEFLQLLPRLSPGVIVHVHDVALPWDYPQEWFRREPVVLSWAEQYLLYMLLLRAPSDAVLWPGYFVQQTAGSKIDHWFPERRKRDATSFWFKMFD